MFFTHRLFTHICFSPTDFSSICFSPTNFSPICFSPLGFLPICFSPTDFSPICSTPGLFTYMFFSNRLFTHTPFTHRHFTHRHRLFTHLLFTHRLFSPIYRPTWLPQEKQTLPCRTVRDPQKASSSPPKSPSIWPILVPVRQLPPPRPPILTSFAKKQLASSPAGFRNIAIILQKHIRNMITITRKVHPPRPSCLRSSSSGLGKWWSARSLRPILGSQDIELSWIIQIRVDHPDFSIS